MPLPPWHDPPSFVGVAPQAVGVADGVVALVAKPPAVVAAVEAVAGGTQRGLAAIARVGVAVGPAGVADQGARAGTAARVVSAGLFGADKPALPTVSRVILRVGALVTAESRRRVRTGTDAAHAGPPLQVVPQPPQLLLSVVVSVSQPSLGFWLQFAKSSSQVS